MMQFAQIQLEDLLVTAPTDMMEMLIMDYVHQLKEDALPIKNVELTLNAYNLANVFARRHSLSMPEMSVEIHVKDLIAELMLNVHQPIHHNVCARQALRETLYKAAQVLTSVQTNHVLTELNASIKKEATYVNARLVCQEILIRAAVFTKIH
jgi:hypothetical protein